ncbi:tubulin-specific chaperone cofactor E-like protein isoform X2 [Parasteatoda tepidariorum]|nr:tubulin-specific chaperone cofactor E-like protein isoform X2 [Parasteatoda tepidariorum]XP_015924162.1 tubulin-specific chaperone cofactor E-like protein isoform X2 [Parasteatoda tepidariorum]XP_042899050.1 tubulin-specific chaperone cofactor E-like protein isoform X2 [Parasteatoda tepidariorum]
MTSCSFSEALEIRYAEDVDSNPIEPCEIFLVGSFPGRSSPSGRLVLPRILALNRCDIDRAGALHKIEELCHDVEELDLGQNELCDLTEIDNILQHMPNLSFLNLSHNNMKDAIPIHFTKRENLQSLVLNHTYVPWTVVGKFLEAMPNIQELHLSLNDYRCIDLPSNKQYPNLKQLYICGNPFTSWNDVALIGKIFPNLESLVMADTHISSIPDPPSWHHLFPHLQSLNFNNAPLSDWKDIDKLNHFQKLEDVRLLGISVLDNLNDLERRQHLIAYLPSVIRLNGSAILQKEREDAERAFIRHFLSKNERPKRFYDLEEIHGKLDPLVDVDLSPKKTAQVFVHFCEEQSVLTVNLQQSVQELKATLSDKFGLRPARMRLFYVDQDLKNACGPDELRYNNRKLYSYQIRDGDELLLDSK